MRIIGGHRRGDYKETVASDGESLSARTSVHDVMNPRSSFIDADYLQLSQRDNEALWNEYVYRIGLNCHEGGIWGDHIALQVLIAEFRSVGISKRIMLSV